jgi:hypothetical protein
VLLWAAAVAMDACTAPDSSSSHRSSGQDASKLSCVFLRVLRLCPLLQELPVELCSCTGLSHLDVSKNRLLSLPDQFSNLSSITQLSLTGGQGTALSRLCVHLCVCLTTRAQALPPGIESSLCCSLSISQSNKLPSSPLPPSQDWRQL